MVDGFVSSLCIGAFSRGRLRAKLAKLKRLAALSLFDKYVDYFDLSDVRIFLKYDHTMRVAELCDEIAQDKGMSSKDADLAWLCGLLHDIGRFEQLRIWGTFSDSESMNHAELGLAILDGEELPDVNLRSAGDFLLRFANGDKEASIIRMAVGLHNVFRLPSGLDDRARTFCEIVRDADKVDIIRVFSQDSCKAILGITREELLDGIISDAAMAGFREQRCLGPNDRKTDLDRLVGVICLAFEIDNDVGLEALRKQGYMDSLICHPFGAEAIFTKHDTQRKWEEISDYMRKVLDER